MNLTMRDSARDVIHAERDGIKLRFRDGRKSATIWSDDGAVNVEIHVSGKLVHDFEWVYEIPARVVAFLRAEGFRFARHVLPPA
jgi:hypothetical protein